MIQITEKTTGYAWKKAADLVYNTGHEVKDGQKILKELINVFITVESPLEDDPVIKKFADHTMIDWMKDNFLKSKPVLNWGYSYGQRFFSYDQSINQVQGVIEKLIKNIESKSATISLSDPAQDDKHMPCIISIDFKVRDSKLMATAFFRSQDVGKKIYADIFAIAEISKKIANAIDVPMGSVNLLIVSLHAYQEDWEKVKTLIY